MGINQGLVNYHMEKKTMGVMKMECSPLWAFCFLKHPHDFYIL